jgi:hypothetical protein
LRKKFSSLNSVRDIVETAHLSRIADHTGFLPVQQTQKDPQALALGGEIHPLRKKSGGDIRYCRPNLAAAQYLKGVQIPDCEIRDG